MIREKSFKSFWDILDWPIGRAKRGPRKQMDHFSKQNVENLNLRSSSQRERDLAKSRNMTTLDNGH